VPDRERRPEPAPKQSEADRAAAGRNATPQEGGVSTNPRMSATQAKEAARETPEVKAATATGDNETPEKVERIQAAQGLGGTGDTGEPRTLAEREEAATASAYKGNDARETPDTEVAMRAQDDTKQAPQQPETHHQEANAYFHSHLVDAYRTTRGAVAGLRALARPAESTAFQPPSSFIPAIETLEAALEQFRVEANIEG
jgi:hypothetical protein